MEIREIFMVLEISETKEARDIYKPYLERERQTMIGCHSSFYHLARMAEEEQEWEQAMICMSLWGKSVWIQDTTFEAHNISINCFAAWERGTFSL